jgi:hypothetical protein
MKRGMKRRTFRGHTFNRRTIRMLKWAEKNAGFTFNVAQGSYNQGGVSASAGTHDGAAVDLGMWGVSPRRRRKALKAMKRAGFAAWMRTPAQGFDPHIHAIPFGDPTVSSSAREQRRNYDGGRDGLARNGADPNPWRPNYPRTFSFWQRRPKRRK